MRKLVPFASACMVIVVASFAHAQEIDIAAGGSTLFSAKPISASQAYPPPAEKGGNYPSISAEAVFKNHYGLNIESSFRYKEGLYNGFQRYRPILTDVNGVFAPHTDSRTSAEIMAGFGIQNLEFYKSFSCSFATCPTLISNTHFLLHAGAGMRYYFLGSFFIRPEAHYYYIVGNTNQFHSGNIVRFGASIGYSFGRK